MIFLENIFEHQIRLGFLIKVGNPNVFEDLKLKKQEIMERFRELDGLDEDEQRMDEYLRENHVKAKWGFVDLMRKDNLLETKY